MKLKKEYNPSKSVHYPFGIKIYAELYQNEDIEIIDKKLWW